MIRSTTVWFAAVWWISKWSESDHFVGLTWYWESSSLRISCFPFLASKHAVPATNYAYMYMALCIVSDAILPNEVQVIEKLLNEMVFLAFEFVLDSW